MTTVDARCNCRACVERTENIYRMIGSCNNCGAEPILILYRAGDRASDQDCPVCGNWHSVKATRLAEPNEIPS